MKICSLEIISDPCTVSSHRSIGWMVIMNRIGSGRPAQCAEIIRTLTWYLFPITSSRFKASYSEIIIYQKLMAICPAMDEEAQNETCPFFLGVFHETPLPPGTVMEIITPPAPSSSIASLYEHYFPRYSSSDLETRQHPFHSFIRSSLQMTSLLIPLLLMAIVILLLIHFFEMRTCHNNFILNLLHSIFLPPTSSSTSFTSPCDLTGYPSYLLAIFLIILVIFFQYLFLLVFLSRNQFYLLLFCGLSFTIPSCFLFSHLVLHSCVFFQFPLDIFSFTFFLWNLFVAIPFFILNPFLSSSFLRNVCILWTCISISWLLFSLSEITLGIFSFLMILWDIFAVTHPSGPISYLLYQRKSWIYMSEPFPDLPAGLSYKTPSYELGTGDIIFLGVLVGRGGMTHDPYTTICCVYAVLMGYVLACVHSIVMKKTVPALPAALGIGILFYILCRFFQPQLMISLLIQRGLYL